MFKTLFLELLQISYALAITSYDSLFSHATTKQYEYNVIRYICTSQNIHTVHLKYERYHIHYNFGDTVKIQRLQYTKILYIDVYIDNS